MGIEEENKEKRAELGKMLAKTRKKCDFTQEQIADAMGVRRETVSKMESGSFNVTLDLIYKYCDVVGAKINIRKVLQ